MCRFNRVLGEDFGSKLVRNANLLVSDDIGKILGLMMSSFEQGDLDTVISGNWRIIVGMAPTNSTIVARGFGRINVAEHLVQELWGGIPRQSQSWCMSSWTGLRERLMSPCAPPRCPFFALSGDSRCAVIIGIVAVQSPHHVDKFSQGRNYNYHAHLCFGAARPSSSSRALTIVILCGRM